MAKGDAKGWKSGLNVQIESLKKSLRPRIREWKFSLFLFRKSVLAMAGLIIVLSLLLVAVFAPVLAPPPMIRGLGNMKDPMQIPYDFGLFPKPPGAVKPPPYPPGQTYPLGTGLQGTDIYYGLIWGARTSMYISLYVVSLAVIIGLVLGALAGYYGGKIDELLMRVTDVFLSVPGLILAMAVAAVLGRSLENVMLALIVVWWPPYARIVRGQVLTIKENTYVEAARSSGAKPMRVLFRHVVPNTLSPVLVNATMDIGVVVLVAAGLSFIGLGAQWPYAEWGRMVSEGQTWFTSTITYQGNQYNPYWVWAFPGLMILLFVMGFNLLGDGLRDILDPRLRR